MPTPLEDAIAELKDARADLYDLTQQRAKATQFPVRNIAAIVALNLLIVAGRVRVKNARLAVIAETP